MPGIRLKPKCYRTRGPLNLGGSVVEHASDEDARKVGLANFERAENVAIENRDIEHTLFGEPTRNVDRQRAERVRGEGS